PSISEISDVAAVLRRLAVARGCRCPERCRQALPASDRDRSIFRRGGGSDFGATGRSAARPINLARFGRSLTEGGSEGVAASFGTASRSGELTEAVTVARVPTVLRFEAALEDFPGVTRSIEVRGDQTLADLHDGIRDAFGWTDDHL